MPSTFGKADSAGSVANETLDWPTMSTVFSVNGLVLVRYRELARLSPCKGLDDCPGVGYGVSEILSRSRG